MTEYEPLSPADRVASAQRARRADRDPRVRLREEDVEEITGKSFAKTAHQCHAVSLAIVQSGMLGESRVARGFCVGIASQHSWVVVGDDCYSPRATIVDATLWSYVPGVEGVWHGTLRTNPQHLPHGHGSIWDYGRPAGPTGDLIELTPRRPLSDRAQTFLKLAAPNGLDRRGWSALAHSPVGDWPAAEIIDAMYHTDAVRALVPIDIVGMLTDLNPQGLYLREAS